MNNCSCSLGSARAWACFFFFFNSSSICTRARAVRACMRAYRCDRGAKNGGKLRASKVISTPLGPLHHLISNFNHPVPDKQSPDVTCQRAFNQPPHFGLRPSQPVQAVSVNLLHLQWTNIEQSKLFLTKSSLSIHVRTRTHTYKHRNLTTHIESRHKNVAAET